MALDVAIDVPEKNNHPRTGNSKRVLKSNGSNSRGKSVGKPEWRTQLYLCLLVTLEKLSMRLGQIATVWATTILLGGFIAGLPSYDFWVISALTLATAVRLFGVHEERKINNRSETKRRVLWRWLRYWLLGGPPKFHISGSTVVAGILDSSMFILQVSTALVSLVFAIARLVDHQEFGSPGTNQSQAMTLYYSMVLIETLIFILAKLGWELPRDPMFVKNIIFGITHDREKLAAIFDILDSYYMQVISVSRENVALGLDMSLRRHVSGLLLDNQIDHSTAILLLDVLYQQEEWIKRKSDADKRARLIPAVLKHVRNTRSDHQSREAAVSLLTSLLVNQTSSPEPSKFGPLVLFKALQIPEDVELLTKTRSIALPISRYIERCLRSSSREEVVLSVQVVRRLPPSFVRKTRIPELLMNLATKERGEEVQDAINKSIICKPIKRYTADVIDVSPLSLLALRELALQLPEEELVRNIVTGLIRRQLKVRELEVVLGLTRTGLLTPRDCKMINLSGFFRKVNFTRCLPELVEWLSLLDDVTLGAQLDKLRNRTKDWLVEYLQQSKGRSRPDITKLCSLLVKNKYFSEKFEELDHLRELLDDKSTIETSSP